MSNHEHSRTIERHCDVAILGGSAAGLAAGLQLGRQRRSVIVVDSGSPRNAPAEAMHGYLGYEGASPTDLIRKGQAEVRSYGGEVLAGQANAVTKLGESKFRVDLLGGNSIVARRVLAATGLIDELPAIDGVADHWGHDVIHCPFCHGYEIRDLPTVQIVTHAMGLHSALLFRQLTSELTVVLHDWSEDRPDLEALQRAGIRVLVKNVERLRTDPNGRVCGVELSDGNHIAAKAVVVTPRIRARAEIFIPAGLQTSQHPAGFGDYLITGDDGQTEVAGIYAAGNVTDPSHQVLNAAADGSRVGAMISFDLAQQDTSNGDRPSGNAADWEQRYSAAAIWSGNPNGSLVEQARHLTPGTALDVGAGEGADALWLSEHGWSATANDISQAALDRMAAEATRRRLEVKAVCSDANSAAPFGDHTFDLVCAQYASIPRTPDDRGLNNVVRAVAPGGTLIVVSHDPEPMRRSIDTTKTSQVFDADAYVTVADFARTIGDLDDWEILDHGTVARPPGAATASHHVDDVILRAQRRS